MSYRYAIIEHPKNTVDTVRRFLPDNYNCVGAPDGSIRIFGNDVAGWTLDGYVIPRLASGLIYAREI